MILTVRFVVVLEIDSLFELPSNEYNDDDEGPRLAGSLPRSRAT